MGKSFECFLASLDAEGSIAFFQAIRGLGGFIVNYFQSKLMVSQM